MTLNSKWRGTRDRVKKSLLIPWGARNVNQREDKRVPQTKRTKVEMRKQRNEKTEGKRKET